MCSLSGLARPCHWGSSRGSLGPESHFCFGNCFCSVNCEYACFFSKRVCVAYFRRSESVHGCDWFSSKLKTFTACLSLTDAKQDLGLRPELLEHLVFLVPQEEKSLPLMQTRHLHTDWLSCLRPFFMIRIAVVQSKNVTMSIMTIFLKGETSMQCILN